MRKRATPDYGRQMGGRETSGSPPANKRRRVDVEPLSSERNGSHIAPDSIRHHQRNVSITQQQQQQQQQSRSRLSHEPRLQPAPTSSVGPLKQEQFSPPAVHIQSPATPSVNSNITPTSSTIAISDPPSSFSRRISSSATSPSTQRPTPRKGPPSRLNFQSSSAQGGGGGGGHTHHSSLAAVPPPSIRSAPPVPVHRDLQMQMQSRFAPTSSTASSSETATRGGGQTPGDGGPWLTSRPGIQSRASHPPPLPSQGSQGTQGSSSQTHSHARSHSLHQQQMQQNYSGPSDTATPRASTFARDRDGWPTVPTPTSLRLGSRPIVPPPLYNANAPGHAQSPGPGTARFPTTPSTRGPQGPGNPSGGGGSGTPQASRFPPTPGFAARTGMAGGSRTPAMLSPIPPLGQARHGQSGRTDSTDKNVFMSKMSEMYDRASRATAHNSQRDCGCMSAEEVDRRLRERDAEIAMLRNAVSELTKEVRTLRSAAREPRDGDGDVAMAPANSTAGDMDVDARSVQNGDSVGNVSLRHHRPTASRTQSSMSIGNSAPRPSGSDKAPGSIVPVPPAVPSIPKPPMTVANGKSANATPSPPSIDRATTATNGVEAGLKPSGASGGVEDEDITKA